MNAFDPQTTDIEIINPPSLQAQATGLYASVAAQIDKQITTARAYPRSQATVSRNLATWVAQDEQTAESCIYSLKRGGKTIQGASIRFAEILAHAWGHLRIDARLVDEGRDFIVVRGECHDLQTNNVWSQDVTRRIVDSKGKRYDYDLIQITAMAAASIAQRDSVLKCIPPFIWKAAFDAVVARVTGDVKTLADRRVKALGQFSLVGVTPEMIFKRLKVAGINDITPDHMVELVGTFQAIRDGQTTVEAEFGETLVQSRIERASPLAQSEDTGAVAAEADAGEAGEVVNPAPPRAEAGGANAAANGRGEALPPPANSLGKPAGTKERKPRTSRQDKDSDLPPAEAPAAPQAQTADTPDHLMREWERGCLSATSVRALQKFAADMGPRLHGRMNEEQEAILRDIYDAAEMSLRQRETAAEKAQATRSYETAKAGIAQMPVEMPASTIRVTEQDVAEGEAELERYGLVADIMPHDESVIDDWKAIIDPMLDAKTAQDVMDIYAKAEATGQLAKLPEMDAFHLRTARFRIKSSKK